MLSVIISMIIFAFVGAASPGPVNIIAISSSLSFGYRGTLAHITGASICYGLIVAVVGLGLNQLLLRYPQFNQGVKYLGAVFLMYMSYRIAVAIGAEKMQASHHHAPSILQGALSQGLNPKAWLVAMSGVSLFVSTQEAAPLYLMIFSVLSLVICFIGISLWALAGQLLRQLLSEQRYQVIFNRLMGLLLSLSVVAMFV